MNQKVSTNATSVFNVKSKLARILATENIFVRHDPNSETAYFNVQDRELCLPVWHGISPDLYDMLIVHEVGHALHTPSDAWKIGIEAIANRLYKSKIRAKLAQNSVKMFMNIIEDARIDRLQKQKFPGSKRDYIVGYNELFERDFFGTSKIPDLNTLSFIDRANLYFKGGYLLNMKFDDTEKRFLKAMDATQTFDDVIALTEEIFKHSKEKHELDPGTGQTVKVNVLYNNPEDIEGEEFSEEDSDDSDAEVTLDMRDPDYVPPETEKKTEEQGKEENSSDAPGGETGETGEKESEKKVSVGSGGESSSNNKDGGGIKGEVEEYIPESLTEEAASKNMKSIAHKSSTDYHYVKLPTFNLESIIDDFNVVIPRLETQIRNGSPRHSYARGNYSVPSDTAKMFDAWKAKEKDTINFMIKEFEMRKAADAYDRALISKTGKLDMNKLHSYKFNEDIFLRNKEVPKGKNHGFVMFIDWSGSMESNLDDTIRQLLSLTMFCRRINIPFEVYFFRSLHGNDIRMTSRPSRNNVFQSENANELKFGTFKVCNILSSRMSNAVFNKALLTMWQCGYWHLSQDCLQSTPLNQTILAAETLIRDFQKKNRVNIMNTIFLTDGGSDPHNGFVIPPNYMQSAGYRYPTLILDDKKTRKTYVFDKYSDHVTGAFLDVLKERTGTNLIGFFLSGVHSLASIPEYLLDKSEKVNPVNEKSWKESAFVATKSAGYDEYYIINASKLKTAYGNDELVINNNMTASKRAKEFAKVNGKKAVNRTLLSRFITQIAK